MKKPQEGLIHWCAGGIGVRHIVFGVVRHVVNSNQPLECPMFTATVSEYIAALLTE
jgi:hypothetical protein